MSIDSGFPSTRAHGGIRSTISPEIREQINEDRVTRILKWVLLATAIICFGLIGLMTIWTYQDAPPQPDRIVAQDGTALITGADLTAGKAGFQKADLMDYGSLYGMGSYFGPDYTAQNLVALASATEQNLATTLHQKDFASLTADEQAAIKTRMQGLLRGVDLTQPTVTVPPALAQAITAERDRIAASLLRDDFATATAGHAALIRRRPGKRPTS